MAPSSSSSSISTLSDSAKHSSVSSTPTTTSTTLHQHIMIFGASIKKDPFKNIDQNHVGKEEDGFYFVKTTSVVLANGKRKIPQFIDFFASDKTKADQEPAIKKRKRTAVGPRYSPPPPTTDLDLSIGRGNVQQPPADDNEDQWKIKKVLKKSDVDGSSRLLLGRSLVQEHIPPHVHMGEQGVEITVRDVDTGSDHMLLLKLWKSKSYVFVKNWMSDFVTRRELEEKDEIGLRWNHHNSCLDFTLLKKGNS
ncbi:UNVERIFIED_CONTAM: B3 domain-containing protein [Sesamum calycinum]|uniref:B3 domain-containing protein n=1 Tax=Sesamum calycinum TaxID=2727403 RepID=A0AAW2SF43_9LAMI